MDTFPEMGVSPNHLLVPSGVIKHGWLENGPCKGDLPIIPPFIVDFRLPCLITRGYMV